MKLLFSLTIVPTILAAQVASALVCKDTTGDITLTVNDSSLPLQKGKLFSAVLVHTQYGETHTYKIEDPISFSEVNGEYQCGQDDGAGFHLGFSLGSDPNKIQSVELLEEYHGGYGGGADHYHLTCD